MSEFLQAADLWLPGVIAMLTLICWSGFFSGSETALFYLTHDELRGFRVGQPSQRSVAKLMSDPERLLTAILFWNLLINLCYFAVSIVVGQRLASHGHRGAAGVFAVASLFVIIVFGEVLPKCLAVAFHRRLSMLVIWPLSSTVRVLDPIVPLLRKTSRSIRRAFWPHVSREPYLDADDLERAVEASPSGQLRMIERDVLHNVLDLSEIPVEDVMRPRGSYMTRVAPVNLTDLNREVPPSNYLMITDGRESNVESAVPLARFSVVPDENLQSAAEDVVHVPWCANLAETLQLLRDRFASVVSVVNEYGETIGIVTYEDIIDTILMPQPSRTKRLLKREPVLEVAPGKYHVDGLTTLRYLSARLEIDFDSEEESQSTVAGLFHEQLRQLPVRGDSIAWRGFNVKVIDVSSKGAIRVMISKQSGVESRKAQNGE
ncbi:MAG: CNNM domain-containing protein [Planctomycetota bacterium]|nr:CNNM domain-containing protein [Planctomycetota bacterium]